MRSALAFALVATLLVAPITARAQSAQEAAAVVRFTKGRELFMARDYGPALVEFRAASELFSSPNTRLYIARCERELGHPGAAYVDFQRAASDAADRAHTDPKYATTRDAAKQEARALEGQFGVLVIKSKDWPGLVVRVGESTLSSAALGVPTPMDPGAVEITVSAKGKLTFKHTIAIKAGETTEIVLALEDAPSDKPEEKTEPRDKPKKEVPAALERPRHEAPENENTEVEHRGGGVRVAGLFVIAGGLVGVGGFAIFGAVAQSQYDQLRGIAMKPPLPSDYASRITDGERNQTIANVMLGVGIGGLVVGGLMFALGGETTSKQAALRPIFGVGPHGGFVGAARAF